ncbi:hypothetical protein [Candidatus Poriferisodalis sp.]|uniref:hypothetical protein n=1 Tax=Candidatus Poriferisodalis sp. TaxID=3101277 RepID=UPI003B01DE69
MRYGDAMIAVETEPHLAAEEPGLWAKLARRLKEADSVSASASVSKPPRNRSWRERAACFVIVFVVVVAQWSLLPVERVGVMPSLMPALGLGALAFGWKLRQWRRFTRH